MTALARALSIALHPFATMSAFALGAGALGGVRGEALLAACAVIVPIAALVAQRRLSRRWRTVDASDVRERPALYAVAALASAGALAIALLRGAPPVAARSVGSVLLVFAIAAALGRRLKVSLHVAFAVLASASLVAVGAAAGWALAALVPPLAWSRLHLGRHTPVEVAAGALLGACAALVVAVR